MIKFLNTVTIMTLTATMIMIGMLIGWPIR